MGDPVKEYLPHGVTENEFLERLDPENLENLQKGIAYTMIRRKTFEFQNTDVNLIYYAERKVQADGK